MHNLVPKSVRRAGACVLSAVMSQGPQLALAMLLAGAVGPPPAAAAGGSNVWVVGASTTTTAFCVTASAATYYDVKLVTGAAGGFIKVFNLASVTGVCTSCEANMLDAVVISTAGTTNGTTFGNIQTSIDAVPKGTNASTGICGIKSAAGDVWLIRWAP